MNDASSINFSELPAAVGGFSSLYRDYLNDLYGQVESMYKQHATIESVRHNLHMEKYSDFRQYPNYEATFADNAETIYRQLQQQSQ